MSPVGDIISLIKNASKKKFQEDFFLFDDLLQGEKSRNKKVMVAD